jgi:hypothetical protein
MDDLDVVPATNPCRIGTARALLWKGHQLLAGPLQQGRPFRSGAQPGSNQRFEQGSTPWIAIGSDAQMVLTENHT